MVDNQADGANLYGLASKLDAQDESYQVALQENDDFLARMREADERLKKLYAS